MEIDTAAPASSATAASGRPGHRGTAGDGQEASPFLSLLAALQPAAEALEEPVAVPDEALPAQDPLPGNDTAVDAVPLATQALAAAVPPQPVEEQAAGLVPGRAAGHGAHSATGVDPAAGAAGTGAVDGAQAAADAVAAEPGPVESPDAASASTQPAASRKPRSAGAGWQPMQEAAASEQTDETRQLQRQAQAAELQAAVVQARAGGSAAAQAASAPVAGSAWAEAWGGTGRPQQVARAAERHGERGAQPLSTLALGTGSAELGVQGNGAAMAPTPASALVPAGHQATATLAEKMRFWSLRGVQNATLELEAFDGATVDVHIAVQGREAKVEFRSDVPEARRWLQDAMPQLQDMLQTQGIALAGGSVGSGSGQRREASTHDGGAVPATARSGIVRMGLADAQALQATSASPPARGMGHTVDLFV